jgi:hypothetical protein
LASSATAADPSADAEASFHRGLPPGRASNQSETVAAA